MEIVKKDQNPTEDRSDAPIFYGGKVEGRSIVGGGMSSYFNFNQVTFYNGSKNYFHVHTSDQILVITEGIGIVATESEERVVSVGDVIHIPAGEKHWHGGRKESYMSHITITGKGSDTTQLES